MFGSQIVSYFARVNNAYMRNVNLLLFIYKFHIGIINENSWLIVCLMAHRWNCLGKDNCLRNIQAPDPPIIPGSEVVKTF